MMMMMMMFVVTIVIIILFLSELITKTTITKATTMFGQGFTFSYCFSIIIFLRFCVKNNVLVNVETKRIKKVNHVLKVLFICHYFLSPSFFIYCFVLYLLFANVCYQILEKQVIVTFWLRKVF